jgi:hypothetical protein
MFVLMDGFPARVVAVRAVGRIKGEDYGSVLAPAVAAATTGDQKARLLVILGPDFEGYDPSGMMADTTLGIGHLGAFERIAVVTDVAWIRDGIGLFAGLIPGDVRLFPNAETDAATAWIAAEIA